MNRQFTYSLNRLYDNSTQLGQLLQDNTYKYDNVGNIISIDDNGLNARNQYFEYDNINRLIYSKGGMNCQGTGIGYETDYTYSAAGRILRKNVTIQRINTMAGLYPMDYQNNYTYPSSGNPFAIRSVQDALSGSVNNLEWDANGNLIRSVCGTPVYDRRMCWTEDNRMQGYTEYSDDNGGISAWYNYAASGDRNFKVTTPRIQASQNAANLMQHASLAYPTLYASALITFNKGGYTKHYFEGTNRVCSKIGGGFRNVHWDNIEDRIPTLVEDYDQLSEEQRESVERTFNECLNMGVEMDGIIDLYEVVSRESGRDDQEPAFFYHSDHLGSASWITDFSGVAVQHIQYLPYGEPYINQRLSGYNERFTFTGKDPRKGWRIPLDEIKYNEQRDEETGYGYFGARYMDHELMSMWLSVDPLADKYPSISPYAYCAWNPIKLVDPNGMEVDDPPSKFKNIGPVIPKSDFIGWHYGNLEENCNVYAKEQMRVAGYSVGGGDDKANIKPYNENKKPKSNEAEFNKAVDYIKSSLENGIPVFVGVDDQAGASNSDNTTDHFIVIVGMGYDEEKGNYFTAYDNATPYPNEGTSDQNRLYVDYENNVIQSDGRFPNNYARNVSRPYTVTQVRQSRKKKK